ncbi:MAG TPA: nitrite reductase (NAD(P)H) small subunit [Mycobacterium sp.]
MNQQLDEADSALLCRMVSGLGISVHLDVGTDSIERLGDDALRVATAVRTFSGVVERGRGCDICNPSSHRSWLRRVANTSSTASRPRCACVQAPIKKQAFAFDDGVCLDDPSVAVPVYRTRLTADADVQVSV